MFAFAFRAPASGNRIANLFLFVCWKKEGSGQFSCWGLNPDQRIESPVPYPLRQLAHGFESQILRAKLSRDSKFLKSLQTKKSSNARHANTRSAKHQCETSVKFNREYGAVVQTFGFSFQVITSGNRVAKLFEKFRKGSGCRRLAAAMAAKVCEGFRGRA